MSDHYSGSSGSGVGLLEEISRIDVCIERCAGRLRAAGIETPRRDAELLVRRVLRCSTEDLHCHPERTLTIGEVRALSDLVDRRAQRVPLPYLLGEWEFYGRPFLVSPAVLIPRPETEHLVEVALRRSGDRLRQGGAFLDIGTGSGCIAVTLALQAPGCRALALDISAEALDVARRNALRHGVSLELTPLDFLTESERLPANVDALVSNPPYIALNEAPELPPEVRDHEPRAALFSGPTGLEFYAQLFVTAARCVRPGGLVAVELAAGRAEAVRSLALASGLTSIEVEPDLAGIPRVLSGVIAS